MKNTKNRLEKIQNYLLILIVLASLLSFGSVQAAPAIDDPLPTETVVSIEATTEATPTVVEPTPVVVEPTPTVVEITPVVVEPTPIVVEPTPTVYAIISADAPAAPTPQSPSGTIATGNPTFTWTRPAGATQYALYVYTNATPSVMRFANYVTPTCGTTTCSYTPTLNLTAGSYKWQVRAGNADGWSLYSTWLNFTVSAPAAPTPLSPNGAGNGINPTFT